MPTRPSSLNKIIYHRFLALKKLTSKVVHDTNNYYAAIQGYVSIIDMKYSDATLKGYLGNMSKAIDTGIAMNKGLTRYYRTADLMMISTDMEELITQSCEEYVGETHLIWSGNFEPALPRVMVEQPAVRLLFTNIYRAADRTATARLEISASIAEITEAESVLMVLDSQPGHYLKIQCRLAKLEGRESENAALFDPYYLAEGAHDPPGLADIFSLMMNHHGNLDVQIESDFLSIQLYFPLP